MSQLFTHAFFLLCPSPPGSLQAELADWRSHGETEELTSCSDRWAVRANNLFNTPRADKQRFLFFPFCLRRGVDTSDANTDGIPPAVRQKLQRARRAPEHTGRTNKHWAAQSAERQRLIPEYIYFLLAAARHPCRLLMWYRSWPAQYQAAARNKSKAFFPDKHRASEGFCVYWILTCSKLETREKRKFGKRY